MENPLAKLETWWSDKLDDGNANTELLSLESRGETFRLDFKTADDADAYAEWRLDIDGCIESRWLGERGEPSWFEDHVLLLPHLDRRAWISFAKPLRDPIKAYGAFALAHGATVDAWIRLDRYFRTSMLNAPFGVLAQGAETLIAAYAEALLKIGEDIGMASQDRARPIELPHPSVLTWSGSYFVARDFRLHRTE